MKKSLRNTLLALSGAMIIGIGSYAFAGWGMGPGYGGGNGMHGGGQGMRGGGCPGWGAGAQGWAGNDLTEEQVQKLDAERQAFFNATADLRNGIHEKRLAIKAEMAKAEPDRAALMDLQKSLSDLRSQMDERRIDHMLAMRKIAPDFKGGYGAMGKGRHGRGMGRGMGPGMGRGMGPGTEAGMAEYDCPWR